jgi:2-polyprenyl-6-methoxyphenol hydroxylase-like FAD-dependent oxidoreductase
MPHAIVIGAGPAGSLSALLLARAGFEVDLLEQHRFPRDKVCGECLSALGLDVLDRAGLTAGLRSLGPVTLTRTLVHPGDGPTLDLPLPRPMWGLTRYALDRAMLAAAAGAGVVVHQPARCEAVELEARPRVRWRDLRSNRLTTAVADWLVVADGKGAFLPPGTPPASGDLGIKAHFEGVDGPRDAIELFAGPNCYGGLAAVNGDRWNAAFSIPAAAVRQARGDLAAAFEAVVAFNPELRVRMMGARRVTRWLAAPLPRFPVTEPWPHHVVPVGNAAAALEPIGGEGMGLALRSAELAAARIASATSGNPLLPDAYRRLWRTRRGVCRVAARAVSIPPIADALAPIIFNSPWLGLAAMRWAGKAARPT